MRRDAALSRYISDTWHAEIFNEEKLTDLTAYLATLKNRL